MEHIDLSSLHSADRRDARVILGQITLLLAELNHKTGTEYTLIEETKLLASNPVVKDEPEVVVVKTPRAKK